MFALHVSVCRELHRGHCLGALKSPCGPAQGIAKPLTLVFGSKSKILSTLLHLPSKFKVYEYLRHCCCGESQPRSTVVPVGPGALRRDGRVALVMTGDIERQC